MYTEREETTYGTKDELIAKLVDLGKGWEHLGNTKLAREAGDGIYDLQTGCTATQVGHTLYKVTDHVPGRTIPDKPGQASRA